VAITLLDSLQDHALFKAIADHSGAVIGAKTLEGRYVYVNAEYSRLFHRFSEDFIGRTDAEVFPPEIAAKFREADLRVQQTGESMTFEEVAPVDGELRDFLSVKFPIRDHQGTLWAMGILATDVTERRRAERERDTLLAQLQEALAKIKTLGGLIPICAACKRIRHDDGYWEQIDEFIRHNSEATFTHGICPPCKEAALAVLNQPLNE
jgi:PAS domain S-box-containing protein